MTLNPNSFARNPFSALICSALIFGTLGAPMLAAPAAAQAATPASKLVAGATIYDTKGEVVGTIDAVEAGSVIVNTGTNQIAIPPASFGATDKGPLLAATRAELNAAAEGAARNREQALTAALIPGVTVLGTAGNVIGSVKTIKDGMVLIATEDGEANVPRKALSLETDGLHLGMTAEDFAAALAAAQPAS